jgi:hypothetical protein
MGRIGPRLSWAGRHHWRRSRRRIGPRLSWSWTGDHRLSRIGSHHWSRSRTDDPRLSWRRRRRRRRIGGNDAM